MVEVFGWRSQLQTRRIQQVCFLAGPAGAAASFRSSCVEVLGEAPGCRGARRRLSVLCEEDCDDVKCQLNVSGAAAAAAVPGAFLPLTDGTTCWQRSEPQVLLMLLFWSTSRGGGVSDRAEPLQRFGGRWRAPAGSPPPS